MGSENVSGADNQQERPLTAQWVVGFIDGVRRFSDLSERIVPFFEANPLRTAKAGDFAGFAAVIRLMKEGFHLNDEGLRQIAEIVATINRRKRSQLMESSEAIRQPSHLDG